MEYKYLFHEISEQRRSEIAQMSVSEANKKIASLDQEWTGNCRTGIQQAQKSGDTAFKNQKAGAYNQLLFKIGDALDRIQEKDYISQTKTGAAQDFNSYMDCLSMVILFICTLGFFVGGALGVALSYVVAAIAKYGTILILKLVPGIAPAFENASEQVYILFFPVFLILLLFTVLLIIGIVTENGGAVGKKKKLEDQLSKIRGRFSGLEREHQIYGLIVELAELCKTYARDKGSAGNLRKLSWQDATNVTDQIIQYFRPVRNGYDDAMKTLVDLYKQGGR